MKFFWIILLFCSALLAFKCNTHWKERKNTKIDLIGYFEKDYKTIKLGDTLTFMVPIPDTLEIWKIDQNVVEKVPVKSLEVADVSFWINKLDTINGNHNFCATKEVRVFLKDKTIDHSCTKTSANTDRKPFLAIIKILPLSRGIFYFETDKFTNGNITFNGNIFGISALKIGNNTKNEDLLIPYWQEYVNSTTRKRDFYAFKVE